MQEAKWILKTGAVRNWLDDNDAGAMTAVILANLDAGDSASSDEDRDKFWAATRAICSTLDESPISSTPRGDPILSAALNTVHEQCITAFTEMYENHAIIGATQMPTARTGGVFTCETFAEAKAESIVGALRRAKNDGRWDGTVNEDGLPTVTPHPIKDDGGNN